LKIKTIYTVKRIKTKKDINYRPSHGSINRYTTLCGQKLHNNYWHYDSHNGIITCKKCLKILKNIEKEYSINKKSEFSFHRSEGIFNVDNEQAVPLNISISRCGRRGIKIKWNQENKKTYSLIF
jgi:hypothetical protein